MRTVQLSTFAYTYSSEMRNSYFCRYFKTLCRWRHVKGVRDMVFKIESQLYTQSG